MCFFKHYPKVGSACVMIMAVFLMTGCGAIFNGTRQTVQVQAAPSGTKFTSDPPIGEFTTPASISLERKSNYVLTFEKEGYEPATFNIQKRLKAGIVVLDVLLTGLIGVVVDAATGAWYKLTPESVTVTLTKTEEMSLLDGPSSIEISLYLTHDNGKDIMSVTSSEPGVLIKVQPIE